MNGIGSALHLGVQGIQRGVDQIERGAANIASSDQNAGGRDSVVDSLLGMEQGKLQAQASAKTVQATVDLIGSLLDVKA